MKKGIKNTIIAAFLLMLLFCVSCGKRENNGGVQVKEIPLLENQEQTYYNVGGTDALGREVLPISGENNEKLVGLFYFSWLGNEYLEGDMTKPLFLDSILDLSKLDIREVFSYDSTVAPFLKMYFYSEPMFGYYNSRDEWVIRKHVEMFIMAGIDFLGMDSTNWSMYEPTLDVLLPVLEEYRLAGFKVPKIMFLTNTYSYVRVEQLYDYMYKNGEYKELWFCDSDNGVNADGKPWIVMRAGEIVKLPEEIRSFFYFRHSQWPNERFLNKGFPWIEFERPQRSHKGIVSVSVAQNAGMHMSNSVQYIISPNGIDYYNSNWGRGYTDAGQNDASKVREGANFQEQWDNAIALDPHIIFVTGWNEWAALKLSTAIDEYITKTVVFFDTFNEEFSRDIEPMKGGYQDNYYFQMIYNIRRFKGISGSGLEVAEKSIDIYGSLSQWESVNTGFSDLAGDAIKRDFTDAANTGQYIDESNRNDIIEVRVAQDSKYLYFLITCAQDITPYESGDNWMNMLLSTGGENSFEGFDYIINRSPQGEKTSIERSVGGFNFEEAGNADICLLGKYLQIRIKKSDIGIGTGDTLQFKVSDNVTDISDIMSYYTSGDSAPYGRLSFYITP